MKKILLAFAFTSCSLVSFAQINIAYSNDPVEVRFIKDVKQVDLNAQQKLRSQPMWQGFLQNHGTWYVHFNEESGLPHRAYGQPISVVEDGPSEMALQFANLHLAMFNLPLDELVAFPKEAVGKYTWANFSQKH